MKTLRKPVNFRAIPYSISGHNINIVGMAKPDRDYHTISETMAYLKEQHIDVVIGLDSIEKYQQKAREHGIEYIREDIVDFTPPTISQCDKIYDLVLDYSKKKKNIAIHCAAGHGRTGCVLAAIKLREILGAVDNSGVDDPQPVSQNSKSSMVRVGHFGGNRFIPCTPLVREAVEQIRGVSLNSQGSVEIQNQIEMLCQYQAYLTNQPISDLFSEQHDALVYAKMCVDILTKEKEPCMQQDLGKINILIDKLSGHKIDNTTAAVLNDLLRTLQQINSDHINNASDKKKIVKLKRLLGELIPQRSIYDFFIDIYVAISPVFKRIALYFHTMYQNVVNIFKHEAHATRSLQIVENPLDSPIADSNSKIIKLINPSPKMISAKKKSQLNTSRGNRKKGIYAQISEETELNNNHPLTSRNKTDPGTPFSHKKT